MAVNMDFLAAIAEMVDTFSDGDGLHKTMIDTVSCLKMSSTNDTFPIVLEPCICVIAQGNKQVLLDDEIFAYSPGQFLAVSVDLPLIGNVLTATKDKPYLCVQIDLDLQLMAELSMRFRLDTDVDNKTERGIFVGQLDNSLTESVCRLMQLLHTPNDIAYLAPIILQEIHYRLLSTEHGNSIINMYSSGSNQQRIAQVIDTIKSDISKPIVVQQLADQVNMSSSTLFEHFKKMTTLSPLQYQKRLRLTEARQILLSSNKDVTSVAYSVGYESPSQFSREYSRLFGAPPLRDITQLKRGN
ncbi:MAG: AraC family transcriptional regulator CmrA [Gammaproteobacteria bacterium]|nr:MAG: AraC family transcriptional regulator CmrA [Gammaproteobacteria bacterium]